MAKKDFVKEEVFDYGDERERMCSTVKACKECPISFFNNNIGRCCITFENEHPDLCYEAVKDWSKRFPKVK